MMDGLSTKNRFFSELKNSKKPDIFIKNITLTYGSVTVFDNFSMTLSGGKLTGLLGRSGIGKTSLLKMIAHLIMPDKGQILYANGASLSHQIAYMGQEDLLYPWLTVFQNVTLGARLRKEKIDTERALALLERVQMTEQKDSLPHTLSGGMRQRVALIRTLYEDKPVILMDEPFSALDAMTRFSLHPWVIKLLKGKTILLITHDPFEAVRLCDQIYVLYGQPAKLNESLYVSGKAPRAPEDSSLLQAQTQLIKLLGLS